MCNKFFFKMMLIIGACLSYSQAAHADDWGCQVLLCLADPRGPTTESECKPPIEKLYSELKKGHAFPSCDMAGDSSSGKGSFARQVSNYWDMCPSGTSEVPDRTLVALGAIQNGYPVVKGSVVSSGAIYVTEGGYPEPGMKACVGQLIGTTSIYATDNEGQGYQAPVNVYSTITWLQPKGPAAIDVYVDGKIYTRVHY